MKYLFIFSVTVAVFYWTQFDGGQQIAVNGESKTVAPQQPLRARAPASIPVRRPLPGSENPQLENDRPVVTMKKSRKPQRQEMQGLVFSASVPHLPTALRVVKNVRAISKEDYRPDLGLKIYERNQMVFFKSDSLSDDLVNVVYDHQTKLLYPVSSNLRIENITPAQRQALLSQGFQEQYYNSELKTLFVENDHSEVMSNYTALLSQGLNVSLEIHRAVLGPK